MTSENSVQVMCRVRPMCEREIKGKHEHSVQCDEKSVYILQGRAKQAMQVSGKVEYSDKDTRGFGFDRVFGEKSSQDEVFKTLGKPAVAKAFEGYNCTIFTCGQTGTGKTHTMMGTEADPGLIPRMLHEMYGKISELEKSSKTTFKVTASYVEVYNEQVFDLFTKNKESGVNIRILNNAVVTEGVTHRELDNSKQALVALNEGAERRVITSTQMNSCSSRSHTVFTIYLNGVWHDLKKSLSVKLNLVDLAGRENEKTTQVTGKEKNELIYINKSNFSLFKYIKALQQVLSQGRKLDRGISSAAGLRDSKLCMLLGESFVGGSFTYLIVTISPSKEASDDSILTCVNAEHLKAIRTKPVSQFILQQQQGTGQKMVERALSASKKMLKEAEANIEKNNLKYREAQSNIKKMQQEIEVLKRENDKIKQANSKSGKKLEQTSKAEQRAIADARKNKSRLEKNTKLVQKFEEDAKKAKSKIKEMERCQKELSEADNLSIAERVLRALQYQVETVWQSLG